MSIRCWCLFMHWYWYIYIFIFILDVIGNHSINITNINIKTTPKVLGSQHHCALPRLDRHQRRDLAASAPGAGTTRRRRGGGRVGRGLRHSGMVAAGGVTSPPCCSSFAGDHWKGKKPAPKKTKPHGTPGKARVPHGKLSIWLSMCKCWLFLIDVNVLEGAASLFSLQNLSHISACNMIFQRFEK